MLKVQKTNTVRNTAKYSASFTYRDWKKFGNLKNSKQKYRNTHIGISLCWPKQRIKHIKKIYIFSFYNVLFHFWQIQIQIHIYLKNGTKIVTHQSTRNKKLMRNEMFA